MAFKAPATQSLPAQLADHSAVRVCSSNPLWAMTMGLPAFVAKYKPRVEGPGSRPAVEAPTDVYYAVSGLLAKGTFSQIYRWLDSPVFTAPPHSLLPYCLELRIF